MLTCVALTVNVTVLIIETIGDSESVTVSVTGTAPAAVGVPVIVDPETASPAGRPDTVHVYGAVPPVADKVVEYGVPTAPAGSEVVPIASGDGGTDTTSEKTPYEAGVQFTGAAHGADGVHVMAVP